MADRALAPHEKQELSTQERTRPGRTSVPRVDIYETPHSLWLWVDMPGVEEQAVEVNVMDNLLSIEGRVSLSEYEGLGSLYTEYNVGNYARQFTLPNRIDPERIKARMVNGVLALELPKAERAQPRQIKVVTS
jgi:HSP20 family protein